MADLGSVALPHLYVGLFIIIINRVTLRIIDLRVESDGILHFVQLVDLYWK